MISAFTNHESLQIYQSRVSSTCNIIFSLQTQITRLDRFNNKSCLPVDELPTSNIYRRYENITTYSQQVECNYMYTRLFALSELSCTRPKKTRTSCSIKFAAGLLPGSHQADIRMRSHCKTSLLQVVNGLIQVDCKACYPQA